MRFQTKTVLILTFFSLAFAAISQSKYIGQEKLYYGAAYYPEAWDFETVEEDIRLMKKANINVVRMSEFSWNLMEPTEGKYEFEWLQKVIDQLYEAGIEAVIGTPTATPPAWMAIKYPDIFIEEQDGTLREHGARRNVKYNHPLYNEKCRLVCEALAKAVGSRKGVIGWQTDNEFHLSSDYSDLTKNDWKKWIRTTSGIVPQHR